MRTFTLSRRPIPYHNGAFYNQVVSELPDQQSAKQFSKPKTQYTKAGDINIAYQVFGSGSLDLVYIPGWVSNIDWMWSCPELVSFLQELGKIARVILFDKRGTGLSDRTVDFSSLEERMEDIQAVMNAAGSERAVLFGHSEGGSVSTLFAATYPDKVISLITFGVFAKRRYSADYPWAPTDEERNEVYEMIENRWGCDNMEIEKLAPSKVNDPVFMNWLASYFRFGASPSAAMVLTKMNTEVDITDILKSVKVPTLILQRTNDIDVKIEEGRYMSQQIKGSRFVEFDGNDHLFWVGNTEEVLNEMKVFILETYTVEMQKTALNSVLVAQLPERSNATQYENISKIARNHNGKVLSYQKNEIKLTFKGPAKAVNCAMTLKQELSASNTEFFAGIYLQERPLKDGNVEFEEKDNLASSILALAYPNQILITQGIKHLMSGIDLSFSKHNTIFDPETVSPCILYQVTQKEQLATIPMSAASNEIQPVTFLESVLESIENHLSNESFGVDILSRETGVSERQLQRKIKSLTNKSPNQLINSLRLNKAKELLMLQQYTVAEIAFMTGFSSPSYFSKCFKKEFGISPTSTF
ncbi:MAG: alpha/beta fold hydrolase [Bacteroidota bacterium]